MRVPGSPVTPAIITMPWPISTSRAMRAEGWMALTKLNSGAIDATRNAIWWRIRLSPMAMIAPLAPCFAIRSGRQSSEPSTSYPIKSVPGLLYVSINPTMRQSDCRSTMSMTTLAWPDAPITKISSALMRAPHEFRHGGMARLADSLTARDREKRQSGDPEVQPQAPVIDVPDIQVELLFP